jgi:P27 family predicted phage terminase small subunit
MDRRAYREGHDMKGRKPTPTHLRALRGNPGKRTARRREPAPPPPPAAPTPPRWLDPKARRVWRTLAPELHTLGLLTPLDLDAFAAYCLARARWKEAEDQVAKKGEVVKSPNGYPIQNPWLAIANRAAKQMADLAGEFGLTPSARTRIDAKPPADLDPLQKFLQRDD